MCIRDSHIDCVDGEPNLTGNHVDAFSKQNLHDSYMFKIALSPNGGLKLCVEPTVSLLLVTSEAPETKACAVSRLPKITLSGGYCRKLMSRPPSQKCNALRCSCLLYTSRCV